MTIEKCGKGVVRLATEQYVLADAQVSIKYAPGELGQMACVMERETDIADPLIATVREQNLELRRFEAFGTQPRRFHQWTSLLGRSSDALEIAFAPLDKAASKRAPSTVNRQLRLGGVKHSHG
ncbi:MAG: hypothetical protein ABSH36_19075 [Solirubrobacteraceae bacterium]